jgi:hypothetical protein
MGVSVGGRGEGVIVSPVGINGVPIVVILSLGTSEEDSFVSPDMLQAEIKREANKMSKAAINIFLIFKLIPFQCTCKITSSKFIDYFYTTLFVSKKLALVYAVHELK